MAILKLHCDIIRLHSLFACSGAFLSDFQMWTKLKSRASHPLIRTGLTFEHIAIPLLQLRNNNYFETGFDSISSQYGAGLVLILPIQSSIHCSKYRMIRNIPPSKSEIINLPLSLHRPIRIEFDFKVQVVLSVIHRQSNPRNIITLFGQAFAIFVPTGFR
jgi:hypothetical protein